VRFETKTPSEFVRVYAPQEGGKGQASTWMMRASEIKGLNAQQIASKYALPHVLANIYALGCLLYFRTHWCAYDLDPEPGIATCTGEQQK